MLWLEELDFLSYIKNIPGGRSHCLLLGLYIKILFFPLRNLCAIQTDKLNYFHPFPAG